jgi:Mrp family chromosome partitioning ATPase
MLPPTSPRRTVRRSILRHLANQPAALPVEPQEAAPKVARKVIFRHISHSAAPAPLGLLRGGYSGTHADEAAALAAAVQADLAPDFFPEEPQPATVVPTKPEIAKPEVAKPETAPLNAATEAIAAGRKIEIAPPIDILGDWSHAAALAPMMLIGNEEQAEAAWSVVSVELGAFEKLERRVAEEYAEKVSHRLKELAAEQAAAEQAAAEAAALAAAEKSFAAKALDDSEEPRLRFRVDAPQAVVLPAPHAKFAPVEIIEEDEVEVDEPTVTPEAAAEPVATSEEPLALEPETAADSDGIELGLADVQCDAADSELTFADGADEPLASDLIPQDAEAAAAEAKTEAAVEDKAAGRAASPLWEVDQFHWPRTCEKLFADEQGYLSRAGDKLLAAVQDGLKVLAITGTRRGEGRTTLALCLARAAAQAGVQVAVMDADFARPQLASKIALEVQFGWQDAALGRVPLSEAAVKSIHDRVTVLPLESASATRGLSLADPRVTATIRAASATFELLILDMGPLASSDQLTFPAGEGCPFDAAIVVRDLRFATATESQTVGEALQDAGVEAVGIAENFVIEDEFPATSV